MLNDEICKLRNKLNQSIEQKKDYTIIYQLSIELDELIAKYYRTTITLRPKPKKKRTSIREIQELFSEKWKY